MTLWLQITLGHELMKHDTVHHGTTGTCINFHTNRATIQGYFNSDWADTAMGPHREQVISLLGDWLASGGHEVG